MRLFAIIGILLTLSLQLRVRMRLSTWLQYHLWEEVASTIKRMYQVIYQSMKQNESFGFQAQYEAPRAEFLNVALGQSILIAGSGTLPDGIDEGDDDTFLPAS